MSTEPTSLPRDLERALGAHRAGRLAEAEALYRGILETRPVDPEVLHMLGVVAAQQGRHGAAAALIARAIEANPRNPRFHCNMGNALAELGRFGRAIESFDRALALDGRYVGAHYNRGNALRELGRLEQAAQSFRWVLALDPNHRQASINLGQVCLSLGAPSEALAVFEGAIASIDQSTADMAAAHLGQGRSLDALGRPDEALKAVERALTLAPDVPEAHLELGDLLQARDRLGVAVERYRHALALKPDMADAHVGLSCVYARLGRREDAKAATRLAIRLRPVRTRVSRGREDGRILVLQSMENEAFTGVGKKIRSTNTSAVIGLLDNDRVTVHTVYVDETFAERVAPRLPGFDLVFNAITEPDNCPHSLEIAQRFVDGLTVPVVNRPDRVQRTTRDENYRRLRRIPGLVFPKTVKVHLDDSPMERFAAVMEAEKFDYPIIVRRAATHGGKTMVKVDSASDFDCRESFFTQQTCYIIEFIDYCRDSAYYDKMRAFFVNGNLISNHMFRGGEWNMHEGIYTKWVKENKSTSHVNSFRKRGVEFLTSIETFLDPLAYQALHSVGSFLDLEFLGIDFTVLENGHVLVFEANPAMALGRVPEAEALPSSETTPQKGSRKEDVISQIKTNNDRIARCLNDLLFSRIAKSRNDGAAVGNPAHID